MSFLDAHSPGVLKPQPGLNSPDLRPPQDPNIPKPHMMAQGREPLPPQAPARTAMLMGNRVGTGFNSGKVNTNFHAESSGWDGGEDPDGEMPRLPQFMSRQTALPWNSNYQEFKPTLNFMS